MDAAETDIYQFLGSFQNQYVSAKEICRRASGKWRFQEDPTWAFPILRRMLESRIVETDIDGRYRLSQHASPVRSAKKKIWISPAFQRILEASDKNFGVHELDEETGSEIDGGRITLLPEGQSTAFIRQHP